MANKTQQILELSQSVARELSGADSWTAFLRSAAWQYKYPFEDQLLIYAQRPDATACASLGTWNIRLKRWINKGAKGIALLRENERGHYLDYVFDISDTNSFYGNEVTLWSYHGQYDDEIIETLENTFGSLAINTNLIDAVSSAAHNAVQDSKADYLSALYDVKQNSFLEDLDDLNLDLEFQQTAEASVAFMILSRLELPAEMLMQREDFRYIIDFNTPETMAIIGNAVSDISEQTLREIAGTIRMAERTYRELQQKIDKFFAENTQPMYNEIKTETPPEHTENERIEEYDRTDLQTDGRLSDAGTGSAGADRANRKIRDDTAVLSQKQQAQPLLGNENQGDFDGTPVGDRQAGERTGADDGIADGENRGRGRTDESGQSGNVGWTDEQPQTRRGRNRNREPSAQLSLFDLIPSEEEQQNIIREAARETFGAAFSMPQQIIDEVLCDSTNEKDSVLKICIEFSKNKSLAEKAEFIKTEYGTDGKGFVLNGSKVSALWDSDGIRIAYGTSAKDAHTVLSWENAAKRMDELLGLGRFAPFETLLQMQDYELRYVSKAFWNQYSNLNLNDYPEINALFDKEMLKGGYPERQERTEKLLQTPEGLAQIQDISHQIAERYIENPNVMRYRVLQNPLKVDILVSDLSLERKTYTAENLTRTMPNRYISDDEINRLLCGGDGMSGGKLRIYQFFQDHNDQKKRIAFLKEEYGWGGRYDGISNENHDSKGITYSHGDISTPYAKIHLKWNEVEKRLDQLIRDEEYLSDAELAHLQAAELDEPVLPITETTGQEAPPEEQQQKSVIDISGDNLTEQAFEDFFNQTHLDDNGKTIALFPVGDFYEAFGEDADRASEVLNITLTNKVIDGTVYRMCGFPKHVSKQYVNTLNDSGFDVVLVDEGRKTYKVLSTEKAVGDTNGEPEQAEVAANENELIGKELTIDEHKFVVDSVDMDANKVSLKDITVQNNTGFPIFRSESIDFVNAVIAKQEKPQIEMPYFEKPKSPAAANTVIYPEIPMAERNNFTITNDELGYGGAKEKFRRNMAAINLLHELEFDKRLATPEEQEVLSNYVGWGGLSDAFDESKDNWANEFQELYSTLSPEEYEQARASTLTSHFTSPTIIKAMYQALANMGFTQGNILEPSCGIGNFMGLVPDSMSESKIYGIEIDSITGRIAQQLYQKNSIAIQGYEDTALPDSFFDVAIGNVPFGDFKVLDKRYNKHNFLIHDFFFAKTLDKVRPGGVIAFITSSGTMDKQNSKVRKYIAQRADLLGAIRLPNTAFKANAGTEVTADILFLQKRERMTDIMPDWVHLGTLENGHSINQYFIDNPDMIMGEMKEVSGPFGPTLTCMPDESTTLAEQLDGAIQNIHVQITEYEFDDILGEEEITIPADPAVRNFSYTIVDGDIYFRENSMMRKVELNATAQNRIKGMIEIRDCVRTLIEYQTEDYPNADIKQQQSKLNSLYDAFTKKYGLINSRGNNMAFSDDSSYFLLCSLEILDENGELERKADMFTKRTIGAKKEVSKVDTADEALAVSLGEKAKIDMEFMTTLSGKTEEELYAYLTNVIFLNPLYTDENSNTPKYLTADEYLSGNVREKLRVAEVKAESGAEYAVNVEALKKVQPKDLTASEITVKLGSTWIPPEYIKEFIVELLSPSYWAQQQIEVKYSNLTGDWNISGKSKDKGVKATNTYGTFRINAYRIIEETLNLKDVRIFDYVENENGSKVAVLNRKETTIAQQKQDAIKAEFDNWIWNDPDRREKLVRLYNEKFNSIRPREYDGSHITFNGMNPEIMLRKHQKDAVARIMYGGNSLLGHVVGAGKTWTMVAAAMESKRLGLCNKSLFVVPNHLTEQWASEFLQLYPSANIMVATKKDFEMKNRKKFCGRISTGDYDAVIIGHSQFEKIPMSAERQRAILEQQLDEIINGIAEAKANNAERFTVKQMVKTKKGLENKISKLNDQSRKDDVVTFEELGVDRVFVDEAHYYKNLFLYTKMRNVGGIAQTEAQKSSDLFMKSRYLDEITGGKGLIFATGTPISNSMVELYTMQRYLQYNTLVKNDLQHFDAWASTFGETVTAIELAPEGTGYRAKTRFAKFFNLPELMAMFKEVADIQTSDMLNLPVPNAEYHSVVVEPTGFQKDMVAELAERAEKVRNKMVDPTVDNMLKITNDGRKLALDQRMVNELLPDDEESKVSACVNNVYEVWQKTEDIKGTQLVFCDLSTPKSDGTFSVYNSMRDKLMDKGIPENDIAFIHDADSEVKKKELFSKVRKGDIRVLIGSTPKMGAGTNVQTRLCASHDLDCPWRPADLEQRAGRIIRQGNQNETVHIYRYVTKNTFDSYMWQTVENKQKFISQIMTSKSPVRSAEDIDETALSYAEIKALATGNPHIKEKMELDTQVAKLKLIKSSFMSQKYDLEDKVIKYYPKQMAELNAKIAGVEKDMETVKSYPKQEDKFNTMTIDGLGYFEKEKAGTALIERCKQMTSPELTPIGEYRGFSMELSFDTFSKVFSVSLKNNLSYTVELGSDVFGNIQRIDNALEGIEKKTETLKGNLEEVKRQYETAKMECTKEFPQEAELAQKTQRLAELDALLNMDSRDHDGADFAEPGEELPQRKKDEMER